MYTAELVGDKAADEMTVCIVVFFEARFAKLRNGCIAQRAHTAAACYAA